MTVKTQVHTPGPWEACRIQMTQSWDYWEILGPSRECQIADIDNTGLGLEIEGANARLIAAAPQLLEALEELIELPSPPSIEALKVHAKVRQVIRLAKGETL